MAGIEMLPSEWFSKCIVTLRSHNRSAPTMLNLEPNRALFQANAFSFA
jgi:hypothetical protein